MKESIFIIIFACMLINPCYAEVYDEQALHEQLPDYADELVDKADEEPQEALSAIIESFCNTLTGGLGNAVERSMAIIAVAVICSVLSLFDSDTPEYISLGGCAAVAVISVNEVNSVISSGTELITTLSGFSKTLLPAMCAASAACGTLGSATAKYAASVLFMDAFVSMAKYVILPLIYAFIALIVAAAAFGNRQLAGIAAVFKRICTLLMTFTALIFTVYISISSVIASGGDAAASKLAKTAISTALPVVGGIISDAASTVVAGAQILRNSVGVFGMLALLAVCAAPFAVMALNYLSYKLSAAAVRAFGCDRLSELADGIASAVGMILGLIGCCAIILFVSITISIKAVGG